MRSDLGWRARRWGRAAVLAAGVMAAGWGCGEQITGIERPSDARVPEASAAKRRPERPTSTYACFLSIRDPKTGSFVSYHLPLRFPEGLAKQGGAARYRYRGFQQDGEYAVLANCLIPQGSRSADWLTRQLLGRAVPRGGTDGGISLQACPEGNVCLEPIDVKACQYRGTWPNCKPPLAGDIPPCYDGGGCGGGDPIPTGGTGPICEECFPPEEPPCATSDSVVNAPAVQNGFKEIWDRSNADAEIAQRREVGGFVIRDPLLGYTFQPFPESWSASACSIAPPQGFMPPASAVAWVHTHPYETEEKMTSCPPDPIVIGGTLFYVYTKYMNDPSGDDGKYAQRWGLPGYVIDKNKITKFVGNPQSEIHYDITFRTNRCAY